MAGCVSGVPLVLPGSHLTWGFQKQSSFRTPVEPHLAACKLSRRSPTATGIFWFHPLVAASRSQEFRRSLCSGSFSQLPCSWLLRSGKLGTQFSNRTLRCTCWCWSKRSSRCAIPTFSVWRVTLTIFTACSDHLARLRWNEAPHVCLRILRRSWCEVTSKLRFWLCSALIRK